MTVNKWGHGWGARPSAAAQPLFNGMRGTALGCTRSKGNENNFSAFEKQTCWATFDGAEIETNVSWSGNKVSWAKLEVDEKWEFISIKVGVDANTSSYRWNYICPLRWYKNTSWSTSVAQLMYRSHLRILILLHLFIDDFVIFTFNISQWKKVTVEI